MLKKFKEWIGTNLDVYKVENANDIAPGLVRHIWKGEETATQIGTTLKAQIMNDLQKGLVHTLDTIRTVGTNKDIYEVALTGIEEFGVFDGLKLLIRIDGENQFEDVFLKLGGTEYQIYQLKNNMLDKIDKGILKDKKEYLLNFKNNSFVLSDSTLYGSQKGTALEGNRLAEILGLEFGGNIQDIGNKTKGKFYYDNVTKFYYECIEDNSLTYNDSGKFRAISNKPLSDKVENLFKFGKDWVSFPNGLKIQWGFSIAQNGDDIVRLISPFKSSDYQVVACDSGGGTYITGMTPLTNETFKACGRDPYTLAYKSFGFRWVAIGY
nr:MAG TPA: Putative tail fiber protein fold, Tail fiber, receptor [Caudoviricetes sp.]